MHRKLRPPLALIAVWALLSGPQAAADSILLHDVAGPLSVPVQSFESLKFKTVVRQQYDFSCGSAALATLLAYHYDLHTTEQMVFKAMWEHGNQARIRQQGFSLLDMKRYVEAQGYRADGYKVTLEEVDRVKVPGIALITLDGYRHFVVIKGIRGDRVLLGDPARGLTTLSRAKFNAAWNGILFAISGGPQLDADGFNHARDWTTLPEPPLEAVVDRMGLADFMLSLPTPNDF